MLLQIREIRQTEREDNTEVEKRSNNLGREKTNKMTHIINKNGGIMNFRITACRNWNQTSCIYDLKSKDGSGQGWGQHRKSAHGLLSWSQTLPNNNPLYLNK